ncbi:MAG: lysylphosphatidylglycerol synthase domain-containing protein [Chitinophagaceae bacterium]
MFCSLFYALYNQIKHQPNLKETLQAIWTQWNGERIFLLCIVFVLMAANWLMEALKWRLLIKNTESISLLRALQSVLTGVAVSVITPNRIGEYMGRILYLKNVNKLKGITVTIVGSFAQLIVTSLMGIIGLLYYLFIGKNTDWTWALRLFGISSLFLFFFFVFAYYRLEKISNFNQRFPIFKKINIYLQVVARFDKKQLHAVLVLSFVRYFIYSTQFVIIFYLFLVKVNFITLLLIVWLIFWAMAIIPSITLAELGIRSEIAIFFLTPFSMNQVGIISSSLLLWFVNLIIPALIGSVFVFKMKVFDDE